MDEPEGPEQASRAQRDALMMMDLDVDLDSSFWPFDQIFNSPPWQQPCSPLWAFSDDVKEDNVAGNSRILPCNTDSANENVSKNEKRRKLPVPIVEMTPEDYQDGSCIIKERMTRALRFFKDSTEQHALVQVWAPVKCGGRWVLTTSGQPFFLDSKNNGLYQYRMASLAYIFCVDGETDGVLGIPGRVFRQELPEWSPNVQYYSSQEFPRLSHALHHDVRGTLALPVFDPSVQTCVGVLEIIMTCQKINYGPEVDKVCKALEAVNLKSFEILDHPIIQICNKGRQNALAEILEILTVVCETHNLPFAQTWVPCLHRNVLANGVGLRKTCSSFDGSCMGKICMSTTDVAFYVVDAHIWGFREACAEHHLQKGQGIAGRAFAGHNSCFCEDITRFCKIEYPLVHYARMFGLTSCFAICLQSTYSGDDNYVLEFFLPPNIRDNREQMALLDSLLLTMRQHLGSLRVASGNEIEHELRSTEIVKLLANEKVDSIPELLCIPEPAKTSLDTSGEMMQLDSIPQMESKFEVEAANDARHSGAGAGVQNAASVAESSDTGKKPQKKRGKAEKTISLEVLQQYFAGSLKEAAKSLGVCPTTMKRICRQHGISRWPSRKINKVNRSLSKLMNVIESVQVTDEAFTLTSLASSSLPVAVGSISWPAHLNAADLLGQPGSAPSEILGNKSALPHEKAENSNQKLDVQAGGDEDLVYRPAGIVTGNDSHMSKTGCGSREDIKESPTYHDSSQSTCIQNVLSPQNELASPANEQHMKLGASVGFTSQQGGEINVLAAFTMGAFVASEPQEPFGGNLIYDTGSSHDLQNLYSTGSALLDEPVPLVNCWTNMPMSDTIPKDSMVVTAEQVPQFSVRPEMKTFTIKASYGEDIIRFRLLMNFGIERLKEEVAKRLKLEVGTFEIKYLDDDHEWVLIACDADLQECVDILKSSGSSSSLMRLLVHDIMTNLGSSCESYGKCPANRM